MNKKIVSIITSIIGIIVLVTAFFFYQHSGKNDLKAEHTKYLALINDNHDFDGGIKRLETLDTDEGQEIFKNIKTEIKITKELKNIDASLDNKDIDAAKKSLEKVDTLTVDNNFDKAIEWLKEDITNYDKAKKEIDEDKSGNVSSIIDKYKFNHSALKAKLSEKDNSTSNSSSNSSSNNSQSSISDSENIPQLKGQQAPITYGEVKKGKYSNGSPDTVVGKILSEELGGPVANFSNEQIRDAVARYNQKNSQKANTSQDPLETYYPQWSAAVKQSNPDAEIIRDTDGKYYVEGVTKNRVAVIYENPHLVRLVNATTNLHVEF